MTETDMSILTQTTKISKLMASLPVGYAAIADGGTIAAMLEKRSIPFTLQDGYIILAPAAAMWFQNQFT